MFTQGQHPVIYPGLVAHVMRARVYTKLKLHDLCKYHPHSTGYKCIHIYNVVHCTKEYRGSNWTQTRQRQTVAQHCWASSITVTSDYKGNI